MKANRENGFRRLAGALTLSAVMVMGLSISGARAAMNDTGTSLTDLYILRAGSLQAGTDELSASAGNDSMVTGKKIKFDDKKGRDRADAQAARSSLIARKGVKLEHGRPGHAALSSDDSLYAKNGRKGGVKFEHGRPGHAQATSDTLYARKGKKAAEAQG